MSLLNIENLIKRYQVQDPVLFDILNGILQELKVTPESSFEVFNDIVSFGPLSSAGDFTSNNGTAFNVVGVATLIKRYYAVTVDDKWMQYNFSIFNATVAAGGPTELRIAMPPGYKLRSTDNNETSVGTAVMLHNGGAITETGYVQAIASFGGTFIGLVRPGIVAFPASPANFITTGGIFLPVVKAGN